MNVRDCYRVSETEERVLRNYVELQSRRAVADRLGVSLTVVKEHMQMLRGKTGWLPTEKQWPWHAYFDLLSRIDAGDNFTPEFPLGHPDTLLCNECRLKREKELFLGYPYDQRCYTCCQRVVPSPNDQKRRNGFNTKMGRARTAATLSDLLEEVLERYPLASVASDYVAALQDVRQGTKGKVDSFHMFFKLLSDNQKMSQAPKDISSMTPEEAAAYAQYLQEQLQKLVSQQFGDDVAVAVLDALEPRRLLTDD